MKDHVRQSDTAMDARGISHDKNFLEIAQIDTVHISSSLKYFGLNASWGKLDFIWDYFFGGSLAYVKTIDRA